MEPSSLRKYWVMRFGLRTHPPPSHVSSCALKIYEEMDAFGRPRNPEKADGSGWDLPVGEIGIIAIAVCGYL